jgi:uncharacterized protein YjbI with pentapeptide repeats
LGGTNLKGADLREAILTGASINNDTLFDNCTILPDSSKWNKENDIERFTRLMFDVW